jgi:hypothetical protein
MKCPLDKGFDSLKFFFSETGVNELWITAKNCAKGSVLN